MRQSLSYKLIKRGESRDLSTRHMIMGYKKKKDNKSGNITLKIKKWFSGFKNNKKEVKDVFYYDWLNDD